MRDTIRQLRQWANEGKPPNEKFYRRAKSMEKALERIERIKRPQLESVQPICVHAEGERVVMCLKHATSPSRSNTCCSMSSRYMSGTGNASRLSAEWSGKSTLLKSLLGEITPDTGIVRRANKRKSAICHSTSTLMRHIGFIEGVPSTHCRR